MTATDREILDRDEANDVDAILAVANTDVEEAIHAVEDNADAIFTWDYEKGKRPALKQHRLLLQRSIQIRAQSILCPEFILAQFDPA